MYQAIIVVHVLLGLGVIGFVLIQQGKGADAGAAFGSSSGTVFGAQGASSFLSRTTAILAALFFATSLGLAVMSGNLGGETDLMDAQEELFADVPLVNGAESQPVTDALPVIKEELSTEERKIQDEISSIADTVKAKAIEVTQDLPAEVVKIQEEISSMADTVATEVVESSEEVDSVIK
jgi:preprotein translocase subunit SecG